MTARPADVQGSGPPESSPSDRYETVNIGLKEAFLEQKAYQPTPHVLQYFMSIDPDPSTAWIAGGPPLEAGFTMLRVLSDFTYVRFGVANIPALILDSLKIWAGHDRLAREEGKEVATGVRVLPGLSLSDEIRSARKEVEGKVQK